MRLKPAEILILFECILVVTFGSLFHIPVWTFFRFFTQLRGGGIHWLAMVLGLEVVFLPIFILLVRAIFRQIAFLRNAVVSSSGSNDLRIRVSKGWKQETDAVLRGLRLFRDWLPLIIFMGTYWTVYSFSEHLKIPLRDALLAQWDLKLFGSHYSIDAQKFYAPATTAFMDFCYFMHIIILPLFLCLLYLKQQYAQFDRAVLFVLLCTAIGAFGYIFLPAYGPYFYLHDLYSADLVRSQFVSTFIDLSKAPKDAFPSMHVALSSGLLLYQYRYTKWLFWLLLPLVIGNWLSTIYLRYHYTVDLLAGFILTLIAYFATEKIYALYEGQ